MSARSVHFLNLWLLAIYVVAAAVGWPRLPERIPTHFGVGGRADAWTETSILTWFGLPFLAVGIALVFLGTMTLTRRAPRFWNIPEKQRFLQLSPQRRAPIEARLERLIASVAVLTTALFIGIQIGIYQTATGANTGLSWASLAIAFGATTAMLVIAAYEMRIVSREIRSASPGDD
jgi:uncharacterized membrane protein